MINKLSVLATLNEQQAKLVIDAKDLYPFVNRRAFYRSLIVIGAQRIVELSKAGNPMPIQDLFKTETDFRMAATFTSPVLPASKKPRRKKG